MAFTKPVEHILLRIPNSNNITIDYAVIFI